MLTRSCRFALGALAALLLAPGAAAAVTWAPVTGQTGIINQVGQVRSPDGSLHVVWERQTPGSSNATDDLLEATISPTGTVGAPVTIAPAYAGISNPAIVSLPGGGLEVFFGSIQCTISNCPTGLFSSTSSDGGATWTTPALVLNADQAYVSDVNAATLSDGTPFETWWHTTGTTVHRGIDPASPDSDFQGAMGAGCCGYYSNLAADGSGHIQLAWDSNATNFLGVWSRPVDPATGAPSGSALLMPGSVTQFNGSPNHSQMGSRTPIVALPGAVNTYFVAYPTGYPTRNKVLLWQVGQTTTLTIVDEPQDHHQVALAADSTGRLWVAWTADTQSGSPHIFIRRVGPAGLEVPIDLGAPANSASIYALDISVSQSGNPDVLALAGFPHNTAGTYFLRGPQSGPLPAPVLGKAVNARTVSGAVYIKLPGGHAAAEATLSAMPKGQGFVPLSRARQLPVGTQIDARAGSLQLVAAATQGRKTQTAVLGGALFSVAQTRSGKDKGITTLSLLENVFRGSPSTKICSGRASDTPAVQASVSPRVLQTLRANAKGRFRTRGHHSSATVRGTEWDTIDRCDGTLTVVHRGTVLVTDFRRKVTVTVHAGKRYLARAR